MQFDFCAGEDEAKKHRMELWWEKSTGGDGGVYRVEGMNEDKKTEQQIKISQLKTRVILSCRNKRMRGITVPMG